MTRTRDLVPLTTEAVERLPMPCRDCLTWELGTAPPEPRTLRPFPSVRGKEHPPDATAQKQAWVSAQVQQGALAGRMLVVDDEVAGYALFGPAEAFAPRGPMVPVASDDALLLATVWVERVHREAGLGRLLLQAALREAVRLDRHAVEAYGDRRWQERACVVPITWLLHEGFEVHHEHARTPLLRLETRRTVRWAESLEHALDEVLGKLPRAVSPGERVPDGVPVAGGAAAVSRPGPERPRGT